MKTLAIALLATLLVLGLGRVAMRRRADWADRLSALYLPVAGLSAVLAGTYCWLGAPFWDWNAARLTPIFALTKGYHLYYGPNDGPVLNTIYPPVSALAYWPTTLMHTPTVAILVGTVLSSLFFFVPLLILVLREAKGRPQGLRWALVAFLWAFFLTIFSQPLGYSAFNIHADAPAFGLATLACIPFIRRDRAPDWPALACSAVCVVLAAWAKQTLAPVGVAIALYLLMAEGWRVALRYAAVFAGVGIAVSAAFVGLFHPSETIFNLVTLPGHHPLFSPKYYYATVMLYEPALTTHDRIVSIAISGVKFLKHLAPVAFPLFLFGACALLLPKRSGESAWRRHEWLVFVVVGVFMMPLAVLARAKLGASNNAYTLSLCFLQAAALMGLVRATANGFSTWVSRTAKLAAVAGLVFWSALHAGDWRLARDEWARMPGNHQEVAYRYALAHPGEVYFPWNTLSSLMAEGKLYHFLYGMYDRNLGGYPVSDRHFAAYLPERMRLVAYSCDMFEDTVRLRMPEYTRPVKADGLDGWILYARQEK